MKYSFGARNVISGPFLVLAVWALSSSVFSKTLIFQNNDDVEPDAPQPQAVTYSTATVGNSANSELFFMVDQLQQEVRQLRGIVEEQAHQIRFLMENGKNRYKDLDTRVLDLSKQIGALKANAASVETKPVTPDTSVKVGIEASSPAVAVVPVPSKPAVSSVEQKKAYQSAYAFIKEKKFDEAIEAMHAFIEKYPEGELAGNAYYWLGEVYLVVPQLEQARQAFTIVVKSFPGHRKVADALFKLGVTYDRMQDPAQSEQYLNKVQSDYPDSTASKLAKNYKINR